MDETLKQAIDRHHWITDCLVPEVERAFLSGSYARDTHIKPLNDIDIFVIWKESPLPEKWVKHLLELAKRRFQAQQDWTRGQQNQVEFWTAPCQVNDDVLQVFLREQDTSVGVCFKEASEWEKGVSFDLVPALQRGRPATEPSKSTFTIYQDGLEKPACPGNQLVLVTSLGKQYPATRPLIRLAKKWNKLNERRKPAFKSMHLEVLACLFVKESKPHSLAEALPKLFEFLAKHCTDEIPDPDDPKFTLSLKGETGWSPAAVKNALNEDAAKLSKGELSKVFR